MNIYIRPGAALDDATQIDSIIRNINESLTKLNEVITSLIPSEIETEWSKEVLSNWETYFSNDVQSALVEMEASATNLRLSVESALGYSSGK